MCNSFPILYMDWGSFHHCSRTSLVLLAKECLITFSYIRPLTSPLPIILHPPLSYAFEAFQLVCAGGASHDRFIPRNPKHYILLCTKVVYTHYRTIAKECTKREKEKKDDGSIISWLCRHVPCVPYTTVIILYSVYIAYTLYVIVCYILCIYHQHLYIQQSERYSLRTDPKRENAESIY